MGCQIFIRGTQCHLTEITGDSHAAQGLWTEHQPAGELLVFQPVYVFFYQKNQYIFFFILLNSIYFKAIQTAVFYQKKTCTKY